MASRGKMAYRLGLSLRRFHTPGAGGSRKFRTTFHQGMLQGWRSSHSASTSHASLSPLPSLLSTKNMKEVKTYDSLDKTNDPFQICSRLNNLSLCSLPVESNLSSLRNQDHLEYLCPSEKLATLPELVILEQPSLSLSYDLPQTPAFTSLIIDPSVNSTEISEPTSSTNAPKEARQIMKIRRKKMKRHLLKKFRKRNAFVLRKIKRERKKKKEAVFQARLAKIEDWGKSFDAREWAREELDKARLGGFYINVLERKQ